MSINDVKSVILFWSCYIRLLFYISSRNPQDTFTKKITIGSIKCLKITHGNLMEGKVIMQGKLFQRCTQFLYCSVLSLGGNVNTRRMSQPDMGSIFHIGNYYVNYQNYQKKCFYPPMILYKHWCFYSCLQIPPKENSGFNIYATAINFPCIISLILAMILNEYLQ